MFKFEAGSFVEVRFPNGTSTQLMVVAQKGDRVVSMPSEAHLDRRLLPKRGNGGAQKKFVHIDDLLFAGCVVMTRMTRGQAEAR